MSHDLVVPPSIFPVVLPPCSPELNRSSARLYLRERFLSLRLLRSPDPVIDAIIDACCDARMRLVAGTDRIKSLSSCPWIEKVGS